eukprot:TRINITY_DN275_c0_g2_i1.p1 TRINITY_DN275_c0_g2~~TRINITY_DN275_c0_g2_i1.p1  ORF type:complete len:124 (+),score=1.55 TRINITY_DN275_c0_g2_i1:156-527(+)
MYFRAHSSLDRLRAVPLCPSFRCAWILFLVLFSDVEYAFDAISEFFTGVYPPWTSGRFYFVFPVRSDSRFLPVPRKITTSHLRILFSKFISLLFCDPSHSKSDGNLGPQKLDEDPLGLFKGRV